jgi:uncharacterized protein YhbP (UPF0306 family)
VSERRDEVLDYLANHHVMTLATHGSRGPWAAAVFYVNDGFKLTFLSSSRSRHGNDLAVDSHCAAAIHEDYSDWTDIKGVQLEGQVRMLSGTGRIEAVSRYAAKFPVVRPDRAPALIRAALERVAWYELVPQRCFFVDNSQGFGHREEISLH